MGDSIRKAPEAELDRKMREKLLVLMCTFVCGITGNVASPKVKSFGFKDRASSTTQKYKHKETVSGERKLQQQKSKESEIDNVFVFICLLESRFSLLG